MVHVLYVICFCKAALFIYNVTGSLYVASLLFKCIILHVFVSTVSRYYYFMHTHLLRDVLSRYCTPRIQFLVHFSNF